MENEGVGKMQPPKNEFLVSRIFLVSSIEAAIEEDDDLRPTPKRTFSQRAKYGEGMCWAFVAWVPRHTANLIEEGSDDEHR